MMTYDSISIGEKQMANENRIIWEEFKKGIIYNYVGSI